MKIIVDGYNLMYRLNLKGTLEHKREELLGTLAEFIAINPAEMLVVFDGRNNPSNHRGKEVKHGLKVFFSAKGETADDYIMEMIEKRTGKAKEHTIVTSDNQIIDFAREHFMKTMTSDEFVEYLE